MRQIRIGEGLAILLAAAMVEWERLRSARSTGVDLAVDKREELEQSRQAMEAERERKAKALLTVRPKNSWREHATDLRVPLVGRAEVVVRWRMAAAKGKYLFASRGKVPYMEQKSVCVSVWFHMPYSETKPEDLRPRLPVTNWAPHDLRRSCRTQLAILGCTEEVAEAVLGHMKKGVVGVYNRHAYDRKRREWLGLINTHLEAL